MEIILKIRFLCGWIGERLPSAGTVVALSRTVQVFASTGLIAGEPKSAAAPISRRELPGDAAAQGPGRRWLYILYPGLIGSLVGDPSSGRCEACDTRLL